MCKSLVLLPTVRIQVHPTFEGTSMVESYGFLFKLFFYFLNNGDSLGQLVAETSSTVCCNRNTNCLRQKCVFT